MTDRARGAPEILLESPLAIPEGLGPHRRRDYEALPAGAPRCELIRGRFYACPSSPPMHQAVLGALMRHLAPIGDATGGCAFSSPLDVVLAAHSVVQPDVFYVSAARLAIVEDRIEGAPDLVIEVVSPATARCDRGERLRLYAECEVPELWLLDLAGRVVDCLVNEGRAFVVSPPLGDRCRCRRLPEIALDLAAFWHELEDRLPRALGGRR